MSKVVPYIILVVGLAVLLHACAATAEKVDEGAQYVVAHQDKIGKGTEAIAKVLPPPFDYVALGLGQVLVLAATGWLSYRQGKKKGAPAA